MPGKIFRKNSGAIVKCVQNYVRVSAEHLKDHSKFNSELTDEMIVFLSKAAPLHDISKIGIH
jgi:response regulator RpfG family c-di-GMP phosphodiesterase